MRIIDFIKFARGNFNDVGRLKGDLLLFPVVISSSALNQGRVIPDKCESRNFCAGRYTRNYVGM